MTYDTGLTFTSVRAQMKIARMLDSLKDGALTRADLAKASYMSNSAANLYIAYLKSEPRRIHIASWVGNAPAYALGDQKDVKFPKYTKRQLYLRNKKKYPEKHEQKKERARQKYWKERDASKLVGIDRRQPPLVVQIEKYVIVNRHKTTGEVAKALDAKPNSVSTILKRLASEGKVRSITTGTTRLRWESAIHALPPALNIPKQNPFSALGVV